MKAIGFLIIQLVQVDVLEHTDLPSISDTKDKKKHRKHYIDHHHIIILPIRKDEKRRATIRAKLMRHNLVPKFIDFHRILAFEKFNVLQFGIDVEVAILGAD